MVTFIIKGLTDQKFDKKVIGKIHLVVEEIILNIIQYAYPDNPGDIEIDYSFDKTGNRTIIIIISDWGIAFNPFQTTIDPALDATLENRKIGGLGVFLVRKIMDDLSYERKDNKNILTIKKYCT